MQDKSGAPSIIPATSAHDPERRLPRRSDTSGIGGVPEVAGARLNRRD